ncbi:MAG: Uma2 family endonuclease [Deltaproteobacteria bacterium]|nr:Uma2 family endonuclease [Deltaproteobacteria bacterium]
MNVEYNSPVAAASSPLPVHPPPPDEEQRLLLSNVSWSAYVAMNDAVASPGVRMTYLEGWLEIMTPSRRHEVGKTQVARLLELFCLERDIPLFGYGQMTLRREESHRGLEPDECYARGGDKAVPDLALEVVVSRPLIDRLHVYSALGVREVWVFEDGGFRVFQLRGGGYEPIPRSEVLPEIDLVRLARFANEADQHAAVRAYRDEIRREG